MPVILGISTKSGVGAALAERSVGLLRYGGTKRGAIRLMQIDHEALVTEGQLASVFEAAGFFITRVRGPQQGLSGRFNTYTISDTRMTFEVVVGTGKNKGQAYEDELTRELQQLVTTGEGTDRAERLVSGLGISISGITSVIQSGSRCTNRLLKRGSSDVGKKIADIILVLTTGENVYISLKNRTGRTFANVGYKGGFLVNENEGVVTVTPGTHSHDEFVKALGIDKCTAALGYETYANAKKRSDVPNYPILPVVTSSNHGLIKMYVESAFGHGYWYVRERSNGTFQIKEMLTTEQVADAVGEIIDVSVKYPGRTKQTVAKITTTQATFKVEIRNSCGMLNPNEIKIGIF